MTADNVSVCLSGCRIGGGGVVDVPFLLRPRPAGPA